MNDTPSNGATPPGGPPESRPSWGAPPVTPSGDSQTPPGQYPQTPPGQYSPVFDQTSGLEQVVKTFGQWFYWIAGLTLVSLILMAAKTSWSFSMGLVGALVVNAIFNDNVVVGVIAGLLVTAPFLLFGFQAVKGRLWAFIVGIVLYGFDTLWTVLMKDWLGVALHVYVLYQLFVGLKACRELIDARRHQAALSQRVGYGAPQSGVWPPPPGSHTPQ